MVNFRVAALLAVGVAGCAAAPRPSDITKIVLSTTRCEPQCIFKQIAVYRGGRIEYSSAPPKTYAGNIGIQSWNALTSYLGKLPGYGQNADYLGNSPMPARYVWIEWGLVHRQFAFPAEFSNAASRNDTVEAWNRWADLAEIIGTNAYAEQRKDIVAHLRRLDLLDAFTFVSNGCFGTCPAYSVTFTSDGTANIQYIRFVPELKRLGGKGSATVPFAKVRALLAASQFAYLDPNYPLRAVDTWGVSFHWHYRDGFSYDVTAPDSTVWPTSLGALVGATMQLVRDSDWH